MVQSDVPTILNLISQSSLIQLDGKKVSLDNGYLFSLVVTKSMRAKKPIDLAYLEEDEIYLDILEESPKFVEFTKTT